MRVATNEVRRERQPLVNTFIGMDGCEGYYVKIKQPGLEGMQIVDLARGPTERQARRRAMCVLHRLIGELEGAVE